MPRGWSSTKGSRWRVARELDLVPTALRQWVERARADRTGGKTA
jgi:transposase-like protein